MDLSTITTLKRFTFCPGNMGAYDILFGRIPRHVPANDWAAEEIPSGDDLDGGFLLVYLCHGGSGGGAFRFSGGPGICAGYLMEKMGERDHLRHVGDANALLGFLRTQGIPTIIDGDNWTAKGEYLPNGGAAAVDECRANGEEIEARLFVSVAKNRTVAATVSDLKK
jgi:hypothetical protein